ncbi:MAG: type toxin-antitoxin system RelE/ParE family toxin [Acidobacteria bacterium]|nr:type toxin-antitoxin system RelE/ParE family toxin [Acidobacteriota bacterium]
MKVIWSPRAVDRAYREAQYIAKDKPDAALHWLDGLFEATNRLAVFPESGHVVPEIALPEFRQIIYRSHRVIYRIEPKRIAILTVRRSKRLLDAAELQ